MESTRSKDIEDENWLLEELLKELEPKIGSQLPTNKDVLSHFLFLQKTEISASKSSKFRIVLQKVCGFYFCAGIKHMDIHKNNRPTKKIEKLVKDYESLRKSRHRSTTSDAFAINFIEFNDNWEKLFDITAFDAIDAIKKDSTKTKSMKDEYIEFIEDQKTLRKET